MPEVADHVSQRVIDVIDSLAQTVRLSLHMCTHHALLGLLGPLRTP